MDAATISAIAYSPVKGLALSSHDQVELEPTGVRDNRRFHLVGADGRLANGKVAGPLVQIAAVSDLDGTSLALRFPDGGTIEGEVALGAAIETNFFGRPAGGRLVEGPFSHALSDFVGRELRLVRSDEPGAGSDRGSEGSISLVSTGTLDRLAREAEREHDRRSPLQDALHDQGRRGARGGRPGSVVPLRSGMRSFTSRRSSGGAR